MEEDSYALMEQRLVALLDDDDPPRVRLLLAGGIARAAALVRAALPLMTGTLPRASATGGDDGVVSVYWRTPERESVLILSPGPAPDYLYHMDGQGFRIDRDLSPESLARSLDQLATGEG